MSGAHPKPPLKGEGNRRQAVEGFPTETFSQKLKPHKTTPLSATADISPFRGDKSATIAFPHHPPPHKKKVIILSAFSIGATLLDAMVLAVLSKEDTYGYQITKDIQAHFAVSESTLYPVLRRLQKNGSLTTYDQPFQGRNRRYYRITVSGRALLEQYRKEWCTYKQQVDFFLDETPSA